MPELQESRLYTNLPHDKIRAALHALFAKCLDAEGTTHLVVTSWLPKPTTDTPVPQVHYKAQFARRTDYTPSVGSRYREHQSGDITRKITLDDFDALLDTLLNATFIEFAGLLVQQICGTPMGISPAPFIANLFLAWYEFEFLQQYNTFAPVDIPDDSTADERTAQEAQNDRNRAVRRLLREFIWTRRYLDDLLSLRNPHLEPLLKRGAGPAPGHVIHGLYPEELDIPVQQHPHLPVSDVPFLDVLICFVPVDGVCRFTTRLYDKRYQPAFLHVRLSRFIHSSSNVNEAAKRTIFISQFRRLQRIILDIDNFIFEIADLIVTLMERGYLRPQLLRQCADQLFFLPQLFLVQRPEQQRSHSGATAEPQRRLSGAQQLPGRYDGGFTRETPVVQWLWSIVLHELTPEDQRAFLAFFTGSDRSPIGGLGSLRPVIQRDGPDSDKLPTSHTCFNTMLLPGYSTHAKLKAKLLLAIENAQGFGLR
ncbi:Ubiquitin-protein ligase E3A [Tetrabaena socialis]|uniref:HECT-type E3 ubiquitin transferase n=1 Tax=Tetrabaena socialis TaxID=47790 RepID=A0A2J7ZZ41_9CHLO|nr:Ubiquitin-protein ligase E3A [Tetrabaena socialis]|eukprot:PNH05540.1 Ubiquitin-protein ligase E3A [Tetrabaena socialis]